MVADLLVMPSKGWLKLQPDGAGCGQRLSAMITVTNCSMTAGSDVVFLAELADSIAGTGGVHVSVKPDFGSLRVGQKHAQQVTVSAGLSNRRPPAQQSDQLGWLLVHHATVPRGDAITRQALQEAVSKLAAGEQPEGFLLELKRLPLVSNRRRGQAALWR